MNRTVSIIMPVYNAEKYVRRSIEALIAQDYTELEIIVINDGSIDDSQAVIKALSEQDARIVLINKTNGGVSSARNAGLEKVSGRYVMFVDADDYVETNFCSLMIDKIDKGNNGLASCGALAENEYGHSEYEIGAGDKKLKTKMECLLSVLGKDGMSGALWNKIFLNSIIKQNGMKFDQNISSGEDLLFICQYVSYINSACSCSEKLYHYVLMSSSLSHTNLKKTGFNYKRLSEEQAYVRIQEMYYNISTIQDQLKLNLVNYYCTILKELYRCQQIDKNTAEQFRRKLGGLLEYVCQTKHLTLKEKIIIILTWCCPKLIIVLFK